MQMKFTSKNYTFHQQQQRTILFSWETEGKKVIFSTKQWERLSLRAKAQLQNYKTSKWTKNYLLFWVSVYLWICTLISQSCKLVVFVKLFDSLKKLLSDFAIKMTMTCSSLLFLRVASSSSSLPFYTIYHDTRAEPTSITALLIIINTIITIYHRTRSFAKVKKALKHIDITSLIRLAVSSLHPLSENATFSTRTSLPV